MKHTKDILNSLKINELRAIGAELGVTPSGNKSYKKVWIESILEYQVDALEVVNREDIIHPYSDSQDPNSQNQTSAILIGLAIIMALVIISRIMILISTVGMDIAVKAMGRTIKICHPLIRAAYFNVQSPMANYGEAT